MSRYEFFSLGTEREFDARKHGLGSSYVDSIDAINATIIEAANAVAANGGSARVVLGPSAKTILVKPSEASSKYILMKDGVTLDLSDITLKVADDADPYDDLITSSGTLHHARVTNGAIDTNALGHANANIGIGLGPNKAYAIRFLYDVQSVVIDGVEFYYCGINCVVINGQTCYDISIEDNYFTFTQGAAVTPDYDNSACYLVAEGIDFIGNRADALIAQHARALCEIHGPNATVTANRTKGYRTLVNIVTPDYPYPGNRNHIVVSGNSVIDANEAITLWPQAGNVLRAILINANTIHLAQIDHNENSAWGVTRARTGTSTGDTDEVVVTSNIITFQPGDTRTLDRTGAALNYTSIVGIGLGGGGINKHGKVHVNTVENSPQYGIRVGVSGVNPGSIYDADVEHNTLIDCGQNPNLPARWSLALLGTMYRSKVKFNKVDDTGDPALIGQSSYVVQVSAGSGNWFQYNGETTASNIAMARSITNSDTYVSFGEKRVTLDFASVPASGGTQVLSVPVSGVVIGDRITATPVGGLENGLNWNAYVASNGNVAIKLTNSLPAAIDPASRSWDISVDRKGINVT